MPFRITTKNVLQFTDNGSWSQYIRPGKQIRPNVLRSTSLLYRILPTSLGTCSSTFYTFYTSHLRWNSTMRRCFYHPVLGQNAVFHNFAIQFALIQYWQATYFSTKNPINKVAMNNRRLFVAAEFRFVHSVEKDREKHHKLTQKLCQLQLSK